MKRASFVKGCGRLAILFFLAGAGLAFPALAQVPGRINYQGKLVDGGGAPVNDSSVPMEFSLWDSSTVGQGAELWTEAQAAPVVDGLYSVQLGAVSPLPLSLFTGATLYLQVSVFTETLSPRQPLTSVPYALRAESAAWAAGADKLDGLDSTDFAPATHTHDFSVLTGAVTDAQVPDNITINYALDADLLDGLDGTYYRNASNVSAGTLGNSFFSAYSDLSAEGYLDDSAAGDLITQGQGDGRYVNQWETWSSNLSVTGDVTVGGGNIGLGIAPSTNYGISNDSAAAPPYGAALYGTSNGVFSGLASDPADHNAYLASQTYGVYAKAGNSDETGTRYGGRFYAYSQGYAYGVYGNAYGYSVNATHGVYGLGENDASGDAYGARGLAYKYSGSGRAQGVNGYAYNETDGDAYGGYFTAYNTGTGLHYGIFASGDDYAAWLTGGKVHVGDGGIENYVDGVGDLYVQDELEADGNAYVGGDITVTGGNIGLGVAPSADYGIQNDSGSAPYYGALFYGAVSGLDARYAASPSDHYSHLASSDCAVYGRSGSDTETSNQMGGSFDARSLGDVYGIQAVAYGYGGHETRGVSTFAQNSASGDTYGIRAFAESDSGDAVGIYLNPFSNLGGEYAIYAPNGTKNWINPDPEDPDKAIAYVTVESGENVTYYASRGRLVDGRAEISLPDHFRKATSPDYPVIVQVTPRSAQSLGLAVVKSDNTGLSVVELAGGHGNYEFDYTVKGMRVGYEEYQPIIKNKDYVPFQGNLSNLDDSEMTTQEFYDHHSKRLRKIFKANGTLDKDGKVNEAMFKQKGWKLVKEKRPKGKGPHAAPQP